MTVETVGLNRRSLIGAALTSSIFLSNHALAAPPARMKWSDADRLAYSTFITAFARDFPTAIDCAGLALHAIATFAGMNGLPVRLYDYDAPHGRFDTKVGSRRWISYDPRIGNWQAYRDYISNQLGAINVIENSDRCPLDSARAGDMIMSKNEGPGDYTGHTRVLVAIRRNTRRGDYWTTRYEGNLPPVKPQLRESWFKDIPDVFANMPRRWNFDQFAMA